MQTLEGVEEFVGVGHVEACSVIPDEEGPLLTRGSDLTNLDPRCLAFGCELPGIAEEVIKNHLHQVMVCLHHHPAEW